MQIKDILSRVDHTLLAPNATWEQIKSICDDGMQFQTATVCIPSCYVKQAKEYTKGKLKICTVIGFPTGYSTTASKVFEAAEAVANGADEVDMVINVGWLKDGLDRDVLSEIKAVRAACKNTILKVIVELQDMQIQDKLQFIWQKS